MSTASLVGLLLVLVVGGCIGFASWGAIALVPAMMLAVVMMLRVVGDRL